MSAPELDNPSSDARRSLAGRAAADITEVVTVLRGFDGDNLTPAVVQMVQQRIHDLACGVLSAIDDPNDKLEDIRARLWPSETVGGGDHA